ncbi:MAG: site-2 protease family protein [Oscillospiraceae bacterium]|nr:site-2 protease family protein [Oscillospiraceae bacterium]
MNVMTILVAFLAFSLLIFVHELGHCITAKLSGIQVNEFALGMGPKIFSFRRGDTVYALRLFPIGGFCAMEGTDEESSNPRAFGKVKLWKRAVTLVGGSAMNLILGFVLLVILTANLNLIGTNQVNRFHEAATSNQWLQELDVITRVNGSRVRTANDILYEFSRSRDGVADIEVVRDGERILLTGVTFQMHEIEGVSFMVRDFVFVGVPVTAGNLLTNAFNWTISVIRMVWGSLVDLATGRYGFHQMSGPIGVTGAIGEAMASGLETSIRDGIINLLYLVSVITVNLGVFNLLPFPALDGGRLLFLGIEGVFRRPVPAKFEAIVNTAGFFLLIGLIIMVTVNDVFRLF